MAIRRNVLSLSAAERTALLNGFYAMKQNGTYDPFIRSHSDATRWTAPGGTTLNVAHMGPAFLPWHRKFILDFEAKLQAAMGNTGFGLPYFDWTDGLGVNSPIWGNDLMGGNGRPVTGPFAPASWPTRDGNNQPTRGLNRALGQDPNAVLPTRTDIHRAMYQTAYDSSPFSNRSPSGIRNRIEGFIPFGIHNVVHVWIGGQMAQVPVAPNDPVFFLHHCNVDRVWAEWQIIRPAAAYLPTSGAPQGQNLNDPMYPWNTAGNTTRPADMLSIASLGYSYQDYYEIASLQIIITTGSSTFAGTDDDVSFVIRSSAFPGPFWSMILDASHCNHSDPFERGQTDVFTYTNVTNMNGGGVPLTPALLQVFSLGKAPDNSWLGRGDWMVAGLKIVADGLVLYDNQSLNQELNNNHQHLDDGHGNVLNSNP